MKSSVKLFIASIVILAAAMGFFAGSMMNKPCPGGPMAMEGMMPPPPPGMKGNPPPPDMKGPAGHNHRPNMGGPHGPDMKGAHGKPGKGPDFAVIDSILQVTPEQKAALEKQRNQMDSTIKEQRKQKMDAEKALREALDSGNDEQINGAKKNLLSLQESMLDARIKGAKELSTILSKEQLSKLHDFQKEAFKKHKK